MLETTTHTIGIAE